MNPIERIIISIETEEETEEVRVELLDHTPGVSSMDLGELMDWSKALKLPKIRTLYPDREELAFHQSRPKGKAVFGLNPLNLCFFPLPGGNYAIGRLIPDFPGNPDFKKPIRHFFFQFLAVDPETLAAFGNNPILLFQTALGDGQLGYQRNSVKGDLAPIEISLMPSLWVDIPLLRGLAISPGILPLAILLQAALDSILTCFKGSTSPLHTVAGLFSLLPVHWRTELSFAVGLHFEGDHYLRLIFLDGSEENGEPDPNFPLYDLDKIGSGVNVPPLIEGWPLFVQLILQSGQYRYFWRKLMDDYRSRSKNGSDPMEEMLKTEEVNQAGYEWLYELLYLLNQYRRFLISPDKGKGTSQKEGNEKFFTLGENPDELTREQLEQILETDLLDESLLRRIFNHEESPFHFDEKRYDRKKLSWDGTSTPELGSDLPYPNKPRKKIEFNQPLMIHTDQSVFSPFQCLIARFPERQNDFIEFDSLVRQVLQLQSGAMPILENYWENFRLRLSQEELWALREEYSHYIQALLNYEEQTDKFVPIERNLAALGILEILLH
ncbi:MAG: hypothetical protein Q4G69_05875 [Planctomycetia bacterium]|nr:hypothetical protein [Planctomycetia bacterium]